MTPEMKQQRRAYVLRGPCAKCGWRLASDCHEILAGAMRAVAVEHPACWLRLCRECHDEVQGTEYEYQLALKLLNDPTNFDLDVFCRVWQRPRSAVDLGRLITCLKERL